MKQLSLLKATPTFHGGLLTQGRRKGLRPLSSKQPLHLVLKARKALLYKNRAHIEKEIRRLGDRFQIKAYSIAVNFDHLHAVLKIPHRRNYTAFIRALTGLLARSLGKGIWALPPFSRVMSWGKDFQQALSYLRKNRLEAGGEKPYEPRTDWYRRHLTKNGASKGSSLITPPVV